MGEDIWKFTLDFRYEGDVGKYADQMKFFGEDIPFDERERMLKLVLGGKV